MGQPRLLEPSEWERLTPLLPYFPGTFPSSSQAQILVAEDQGEIVGLITLELVIHVGPCWVKPSHRGKGIFTSLIKNSLGMFPGLRGAIFFTNNKKMVSLMTKLGLNRILAQAFKWERKDG